MLGLLSNLELVAYVALATVAAREWWRRRSEAAAWMTATLAILAYVLVMSRIFPDDGTAVGALVNRTVVVLLALFPFCLYRFMRSFLPPLPLLPALATITTAALVGWSIFVELPPAGVPRPLSTQVFVALLLTNWTVLSGIAAARLWRSGRDQTAVARRRMRLLGAAAVALNIALLIAGLAGDDARAATDVIVALLALASAGLFYLGFAPPAALRASWRAPAERALRSAQLELVSSVTTGDVEAALLPFVDRALGGSGTLVLGVDGRVIARYGLDDVEAAALAGGVRTQAPGRDEVIAVPMRSGHLIVQGSPFTPYFGDEERGLVEVLASFLDLAIQRAELVEGTRTALEEVRRTNAELEALVFGISHDLKSPIITLLGFVDLLRQGYGERLDDDGLHFLTRMSASAMYMQELLDDLLELSRIGRVRADPEPVELEELVGEAADSIRGRYPEVTFEVGRLPVVMMQPGRARQLFTNLLENAAKHGGRPDVRVDVSAAATPGGGAVVRVVDDGPGVPHEYREKVFGIFERLDDGGVSTTGTGIGLAICRKILEEVGAAIAIADAERGTTFEIRFPAAAVVAPSTADDVREGTAAERQQRQETHA